MARKFGGLAVQLFTGACPILEQNQPSENSNFWKEQTKNPYPAIRVPANKITAEGAPSDDRYGNIGTYIHRVALFYGKIPIR